MPSFCRWRDWGQTKVKNSRISFCQKPLFSWGALSSTHRSGMLMGSAAVQPLCSVFQRLLPQPPRNNRVVTQSEDVVWERGVPLNPFAVHLSFFEEFSRSAPLVLLSDARQHSVKWGDNARFIMTRGSLSMKWWMPLIHGCCRERFLSGLPHL